MKFKKIHNVIGFIIVMAILYFLFAKLFNNWSKIKIDFDSINYYYISLSFILFNLNTIFTGLIWRKILVFTNNEIRIGGFESIKITVYSRLGKYLPGKFWGVAGYVYLGAKHKISKRILFASTLQQLAIGILSGTILGMIFLFFALVNIREYAILFILVIFISLFLIKPKLFYLFLNYALNKAGREQVRQEDYLRDKMKLLVVLLFISGNQIVNALSFYFLVIAFVPDMAGNLLGILGSFLLAGMLGIIAFFAPAGIGVREGILAYLLKNFMNLSTGIFISVVSRIWMIFCELVLLLLVYVLSFYKSKKIKNNILDKDII